MLSLTKRLAAFDFDHTIIDDNTDTVVRNLLPESDIIPYSSKKWKCWTFYMQDVFQKLVNKNISEYVIMHAIQKIQPVPGIKLLIKTLKKELGFDIIIISDSNVLFITKWLTSVELLSYVDKIFSNPAQFVNGKLEIKPFHEQRTCRRSPLNMCKNIILKDFINSQKQNSVIYNQIFYVGDGINDFCPISHLSNQDVGCVRYGYKCYELIKKNKEVNDTEHEVKAEIFFWTDGYNLLDYIKQKVK